MSQKDYAIKVENLRKDFLLPHNKHTSLKEAAVGRFKRETGTEKLQALDGVSFEVKKGEFLGITGRNGSGKSTLLKVLAGVYPPTSGGMHINGKLIPFIELGVGFNQDLSGRDNIYLNGSILGFSRKEIRAMYDEIVDFAELERFMDQKLKNYSSGMKVRLAFSIAIRAKGDILMLDEVLAVGDEAFKKKCYNYFDEIKKDPNQTVILVTHSMAIMQQYCDRAIMLKDGLLHAEGTPDDIAAQYSLENLPRKKKAQEEEAIYVHGARVNETKEAILDKSEAINIKFKVRVKEAQTIKPVLSIVNGEGIKVADYAASDEVETSLEAGDTYRFKCSIDGDQLTPGTYSLDVYIYDQDGTQLGKKTGATSFAVRSQTSRDGGREIQVTGSWQTPKLVKKKPQSKDSQSAA